MGQEGFCTYYADQIFYLDYETMTNDQIFKSTLGYNIVLSVLPFALMFVMVAVGIITGFCAKSQGNFTYFVMECFVISQLSSYGSTPARFSVYVMRTRI